MSTKKVLAILGLAIILPLAWYLISPLFRTIEVNEPSPLESNTANDEAQEEAGLIFKDTMDTMDEATKKQFQEAVEASQENIKEIEETMPSQAQLIASGDFQPRAHEVAGKALLIEQGEKKILRFEDFETVNGPELHIYLSSDLGDTDIIDLGIIKATKGNVNYQLPEDIDTIRYNKILVWCRPFRVLFSYAELQ